MVNLKIGSDIYPYWQTVEITKHIETIASSFSLSVAEVSGKDLSKFPVSINDPAVIEIENEAVISGFIDSLDLSFSKNTQNVMLTGRDNTATLVDCSVSLKQGEFLNQSLQQIAETICNPLGVPVRADLPGKIHRFKINPGETAFEALDRAAKYQGVLLRPDGLGNLVAARVGESVSASALIEGQNILNASLNLDGSNRFSEYTVKSQSFNGENINVEASSRDNLGRYRPLTIISGEQIDKTQANTLAEWEAAVRAARSFSLTIETPDWRDASGKLWDVGKLVRVISPRLSIDANLLIKGVRFSKSLRQGILSTLDLTLPNAYLPEPVFEQAI